MPYIQVIQHEEAEGELLEIYENLIATRGKLAEVHKIQSLNPKSIVSHMDLYMTVMFGQSPIKRVHREMMAVVVSAANQCEYCQIHHLEAVKNFWKGDQKTDQLRRDFSQADLDERELALCRYAQELTLHPEKSKEEELVRPLKFAGFTDREILDATLIISYFNFVNRIVLGLGIEVEEEPGGYAYE